MSNIINLKDIAKRENYNSAADWVKGQSRRLATRGRIRTPWSGEIKGKPVPARIDFGRWLIDCPYCNGAEYADPDEPFFFCLSCGMADNGGAALPAVFPPNISEIESILQDRPVDDLRGIGKIERALLARPLYPGLSRSWSPGETTDELLRQNKIIEGG